MSDSIALRDVTVSRRRFGPVSLDFPQGEMVWLCGPSGAGKSTLCGLLVHRYDPSSGHTENPGEMALGYVAQDFENQLLGATVAHELEIGRRGRQSEHSDGGATAGLLDLFAGQLERDPHELSGGLQQLLLVTSLLLSQVRYLILDESLSLLDHHTRELVLGALRTVCDAGCSVILVSHDVRVLPHVDRVVGLQEGKVVFDVLAPELTWGQLELVRVWGGTLGHLASEQKVLGSKGGSVHSIPAAPSPVNELSVELGQGVSLSPGQTVALSGHSGSGKSRVLGALSGLERLAGWPALRPELSRAMLRQRAQASLWKGTVRAELEASLALGGERTGDWFGVPENWLERSPRHLSNGQARFLVATCLLIQKPDVLLLDDPFAGLDSGLREHLWGHLLGYLEVGGCCVFLSHHADEAILYGSKLAVVEQSRLHWQGEPRRYEWSESSPLGVPLVQDRRFSIVEP